MKSPDTGGVDPLKSVVKLIEMIEEGKRYYVILLTLSFVLECLWFWLTKDEFFKLQLNNPIDAFVFYVIAIVHIIMLWLMLFACCNIVIRKEWNKKNQEESEVE